MIYQTSIEHKQSTERLPTNRHPRHHEAVNRPFDRLSGPTGDAAAAGTLRRAGGERDIPAIRRFRLVDRGQS
jgi:hypothetical protein